MDTFFVNLSIVQVALIVGAMGVALSLPLLVSPEACRTLLPHFPRNAVAAWALTAIDILWVTWIVTHASLGRFEIIKPALYVASPAAFFILINFLDELLAARALGALLLLAANPVLNFSRWSDTEWRLVLVSLSYLWVVAGMTLILSPYMFRRWTLAVVRSDARCRAVGAASMLVAVVVLYLGLAVY